MNSLKYRVYDAIRKTNKIIPNFLVFEPNVLYLLLIKRAYRSGFCHALPHRPKIDVFVRGILGESCATTSHVFIFCGSNDFHSPLVSAVASYIALRRSFAEDHLVSSTWYFGKQEKGRRGFFGF